MLLGELHVAEELGIHVLHLDPPLLFLEIKFHFPSTLSATSPTATAPTATAPTATAPTATAPTATATAPVVVVAVECRQCAKYQLQS